MAERAESAAMGSMGGILGEKDSRLQKLIITMAEADNQGVSVNSAKKCAEMLVYARNRGACGTRRRRDGDGRKAGRLAGLIVSRKTLVAWGPKRTIKA